MDEFPRTMVGGVSLPRLIIGSNWFKGYSHTSVPKDHFILEYQTRERLTDVFATFMANGVDAYMGGDPGPMVLAAIHDAEQRAGRKMILILTPSFNLLPGGDPATDPEPVLDHYRAIGATFCFPHQCVTDALIDKRAGVIRDLDRYTRLIRERDMIPGLSTHMPEAVIYADRQDADIESYIQIFNAAGFLMQVEPDWVLSVIQQAKKPVMTIKPLAAGRLLPIVGLSFVWSTLRSQDLVTIGTTTPAEAQEVINISLDLLHHRSPKTELQITRSKSSLLTY
jgi:hypothetical protein